MANFNTVTIHVMNYMNIYHSFPQQRGKTDIMFHIIVSKSVKSVLHTKPISNKTYSKLKMSLL